MKAGSRSLPLADFHARLSYWPVPSLGHMEATGYTGAVHVTSFTYSTNIATLAVVCQGRGFANGSKPPLVVGQG